MDSLNLEPIKQRAVRLVHLSALDDPETAAAIGVQLARQTLQVCHELDAERARTAGLLACCKDVLAMVPHAFSANAAEWSQGVVGLEAALARMRLGVAAAEGKETP
jgi:hypothetical protein